MPTDHMVMNNYLPEWKRQLKAEEYWSKLTDLPRFKERVEDAKKLLKDFYLPGEELNAFEESLKTIPKRLIFECAARCTTFVFEGRWGSAYKEITVHQVIYEIGELESGNVVENLTPIQKEYLALWAERLEEKMAISKIDINNLHQQSKYQHSLCSPNLHNLHHMRSNHHNQQKLMNGKLGEEN